MDTFAHMLWTYFLFHGYDKIGIALFFSIFPDLMSFGIFLSYLIISGKISKHKFNDIEYESKNNPLWLQPLYNFSHSIFVSLISLVLVSLYLKEFAWFMLPWLIHILIDVPLHTKNMYPTPFLWPVSDYAFDGITRGSKKVMLINYILISLVFLIFFFF